MTFRSLVGLAVASALLGCGGGSPPLIRDSTPPSVKSSTPPDNASGVPIDVAMAVVFDEQMDTGSVQLVATPGIQFAPTWNGEGRVMTCHPYLLDYATDYDVTITGKDVAGNAMAPTHLRFATVGAPDKTPPSIASTIPADGGTAGASAKLAITFSEPMDVSTVTVAASDGANAYDLGAATWSSGNTRLSFDAPPAALAYGKGYGVTVDGKDVAGNAMAQGTIAFTVEPEPVVTLVWPAGGAIGVTATNDVSLTFSDGADRASVEAALSVKAGATPVTCLFAWSQDSKLVSCGHPTAPFTYGTTYTVALALSARSALGDPIGANGLVPSTFTTAGAPDTAPPSSATRDTSTDVATNNVLPTASITIVFNEPVKQLLAQTAFTLNAGGVKAGTFSWDGTGTRMTFTPGSALPHGVNASWAVAAGVEDTSGNATTAPFTGSFHVVNQRAQTLLAITGASGVVAPGVANVNMGFTTVGDRNDNAQLRTYYTFDLATLSPVPVAIASGQLKVTVSGTAGNPAALGTVWAQSLDYGPYLEAADGDLQGDGYSAWFCSRLRLASSAFAAPVERSAPAISIIPIPIQPRFCPYESAFPPVTPPWAAGSVQVAEVGGLVSLQWADRVNRQSRSQFRVFCATPTNNDASSDFYGLYGPSHPTAANQPQLVVTYEYAW